MAFDVLDTYNQSLAKDIHDYELQSGGGEELTELTEEIDYYITKINTKIYGTYIFNTALVVIAIIVTIIAAIISLRMIAIPTKKVSNELEHIVDNIMRDEGDLTVRINVKNNDEIGQIAGNINNFMSVLQKNT